MIAVHDRPRLGSAVTSSAGHRGLDRAASPRRRVGGEQARRHGAAADQEQRGQRHVEGERPADQSGEHGLDPQRAEHQPGSPGDRHADQPTSAASTSTSRCSVTRAAPRARAMPRSRRPLDDAGSERVAHAGRDDHEDEPRQGVQGREGAADLFGEPLHQRRNGQHPQPVASAEGRGDPLTDRVDVRAGGRPRPDRARCGRRARAGRTARGSGSPSRAARGSRP